MLSSRGWRFTPTDRELIEFLMDKLAGCSDPGQGLIDADVYATSPDLLLLAAASSIANGRDGKLYCYTPIKFRKASAPCRDRSTPYGYWKATNRRSVVYDEVAKGIGFMQNLIYFHGKNGGARTKWMMKEYTLSAYDSPNVALCVIHSTLDKFNKPDQKRNTSNYAFGGPASPYGISTSCANDRGECSGSASVVGSGHDMDCQKLESGSGLPESILFNNTNSVLATPLSGSGLLESNASEDSFWETCFSEFLQEPFLTMKTNSWLTSQPMPGLPESFSDEDSPF